MPRVSATPRFGPVQAAIVLATTFTAAVHVYLAVAPDSPQPQLRIPFLLAALGFLGACTMLYAPLALLEPLRGLARLALMGVAISSIVAYLVVTGFVFDRLALIDKLVEAMLVVLLVLDAVGARKAKDSVHASANERSARQAAA